MELNHKRSQVKPLKQIEILADKGYQGIKKIHRLSYTPIKKRTACETTVLGLVKTEQAEKEAVISFKGKRNSASRSTLGAGWVRSTRIGN